MSYLHRKIPEISNVLRNEFADIDEERVQAIAKKIVEATSARLILSGFSVKGVPVQLEWVDKGDIIPGRDKNGNRYEAYTTWWREVTPGGKKLEGYIQTDMAFAQHTGDVHQCRQQVEARALYADGINPFSLRTPDGLAFFPMDSGLLAQ